MARPILDADNVHAVITTRWENTKTYQPLTVTTVEGYTLETNLDEDSDPFNIVIGDPNGQYAELLQRDNEIRIQIFGIGEGINYLMTGIVDTAVYSDQGVHILNGRDLSAIPVDTIAEPIVYRHQRASDIVAQRAQTLKCAPRMRLTPTNVLGKIATDGSETEWEFWYRFFRRAGQWLWYEPDGTLVSGKLNYAADPLYFFGTPPKGTNNPAQWIPVEAGEFHSSKQQRLFKAVVYYHNGSRILPVTERDTTIEGWLRQPTKIFEQKDIHKPQAAAHFVKEEIFETQVGAQEIKLVVPDPGILIRQNQIARLNVPDLNLEGDWFICGTRIIADSQGFTQEVRLRERNFAISRRVPSDPPTSQEPGQDVTDTLGLTLAIPNHPEWLQFFINAAREFHGQYEFEWFLAVMLAICAQETGFTNERANTGGSGDHFVVGPGVRGVEYFEWNTTQPGPQNGVKNLAEWRLSFGNEPGAYVDYTFAVGPMQLYDKSLKQRADQALGGGPIDELHGNRWSPENNIWIAGASLHERAAGLPGDPGTIWQAVASYGGSTEYANSVRNRVGNGDGDGGWYDRVKEAFTAAQEQKGQQAVEAVTGTVQELAAAIIDASNQHPPKYRDDHGGSTGDLVQIQAMKNGQRVDSPSCPEAGQVQISPKVLGAIKLLIDSGLWVGTFALATDHQHLGCGSDHAWGNAVDISSLGSSSTGWVSLTNNSKAGERLVIQAMQILRAQKRGVYKPSQMICNGVGVTNKLIQSLQLNNYEDDNYVDGDHLNHIHVGYGH